MDELVDCHTHTRYSDGRGTIEENVAAAEAAGLSTIACTDHFTYEEGTFRWDQRFCIDLDRHASYLADIRAARERHPGVSVVAGFECDYYDGCEAYIAGHRDPEATFVLGSVHFIDGLACDAPSDLTLYERLGNEGVWRRYAELWCDACGSSADFDCMAHPDILRKAGVGEPPIDLVPLYEAMAEAAHDNGRRVEVSTAGLKCRAGGYYPSYDLLSSFLRAEVPITFATDAHVPADVATDLPSARRYAASVGYRSFDVPLEQGGFKTLSLN